MKSASSSAKSCKPPGAADAKAEVAARARLAARPADSAVRAAVDSAAWAAADLPVRAAADSAVVPLAVQPAVDEAGANPKPRQPLPLTLNSTKPSAQRPSFPSRPSRAPT